MTATVVPAEELAGRRAERERQRRERQAFVGSILEGLANEPVCGVASEPMGDTVKWLQQILTP